MDALFNFSIGDPVYAAWLSGAQEIMAGFRAADSGALSAMNGGLEGRVWQPSSALTTGNLALVSGKTVEYVNSATSPATFTTANLSWYDRVVLGFYRSVAANAGVGGADDSHFDNNAPVWFMGYLGKGAKDAGNNNVTAGNPPVRASTTSWAIQVKTNLWLYVDPANDKLYLYNDTGSTERPFLFFFATAATGLRP